ncbi:GNAT family N-acetyltransferase [Streptococcus loxodontisalivarius]|uniref:RimJ/RimL family protein N-acetyltransferase n=1 Tax=Streptococcus loxodontisalivarius TaxID=1349415 RepID=A0ABS2PPD9_9STRE|nr:GNAT family N-acetyltransferase [Streptococcus loxodontisalivarius]MBM7641889.1 RimJ/RimL family protein N-acetyltransferase [Streptococcus loxodontisalivarius]
MENIYQKLDRCRFIETDRLRLRPVTLADAHAMFSYASDVENVRWTFPVNTSLDETKNLIAAIYLASPLGRWGIELKIGHQFIGTIDLMAIDETLGRARVGYILDKHYWNQGYATESLRAVLKTFFEELKMNCLEACHDKENLASGRVMQKVGMLFISEEPYFKTNPQNDNHLATVKRYLLTKDDYFKGVKYD